MAELHRLAAVRAGRFAPYAPGKAGLAVCAEHGFRGTEAQVLKTASNESPLGPAPHAIAALTAALSQAHRYPQCHCLELRQALGEKLSVAPDRLFFGPSSNELINLICRGFLNPGEEVVTSRFAFPMYPIGVGYQDGVLVEVENRDRWYHDIKALAGAVTDKTKLLFLDSPRNPLGGVIVTKSELDWLIDNLPRHVLLVLDEAYEAFVESPEYPKGLEYQERFDNVIILRTFAKLYGLADLRLGYLAADPRIVDTLQCIHAPFYIPRHHQEAALAAIKDDDEYVEQLKQLVRDGKKFLYAELDKIGVKYVRSEANFMSYPCKNPQAVFAQFAARGIIVREGAYWVRITIERHEDNIRILNAIREIFEMGLLERAENAG